MCCCHMLFCILIDKPDENPLYVSKIFSNLEMGSELLEDSREGDDMKELFLTHTVLNKIFLFF